MGGLSPGERRLVIIAGLGLAGLILMVVAVLAIGPLPWERPCEKWAWERGQTKGWFEVCVKRGPAP